MSRSNEVHIADATLGRGFAGEHHQAPRELLGENRAPLRVAVIVLILLGSGARQDGVVALPRLVDTDNALRQILGRGVLDADEVFPRGDFR